MEEKLKTFFCTYIVLNIFLIFNSIQIVSTFEYWIHLSCHDLYTLDNTKRFNKMYRNTKKKVIYDVDCCCIICTSKFISMSQELILYYSCLVHPYSHSKHKHNSILFIYLFIYWYKWMFVVEIIPFLSL